jgi:hypothetical protein
VQAKHTAFETTAPPPGPTGIAGGASRGATGRAAATASPTSAPSLSADARRSNRGITTVERGGALMFAKGAGARSGRMVFGDI